MESYIDDTLATIRNTLRIFYSQDGFSKDFEDIKRALSVCGKGKPWTTAIVDCAKASCSISEPVSSWPITKRRRLIKVFSVYIFEVLPNDERNDCLLQCLAGLCDAGLGTIEEVLFFWETEFECFSGSIASILIEGSSEFLRGFNAMDFHALDGDYFVQCTSHITMLFRLIAAFCQVNAYPSANLSKTWKLLTSLDKKVIHDDKFDERSSINASNFVFSLRIQRCLLHGEANSNFVKSRVDIFFQLVYTHCLSDRKFCLAMNLHELAALSSLIFHILRSEMLCFESFWSLVFDKIQDYCLNNATWIFSQGLIHSRTSNIHGAALLFRTLVGVSITIDIDSVKCILKKSLDFIRTLMQSETSESNNSFVAQIVAAHIVAANCSCTSTEVYKKWIEDVTSEFFILNEPSTLSRKMLLDRSSVLFEAWSELVFHLPKNLLDIHHKHIESLNVPIGTAELKRARYLKYREMALEELFSIAQVNMACGEQVNSCTAVGSSSFARECSKIFRSSFEIAKSLVENTVRTKMVPQEALMVISSTQPYFFSRELVPCLLWTKCWFSSESEFSRDALLSARQNIIHTLAIEAYPQLIDRSTIELWWKVEFPWRYGGASAASAASKPLISGDTTWSAKLATNKRRRKNSTINEPERQSKSRMLLFLARLCEKQSWYSFSDVQEWIQTEVRYAVNQDLRVTEDVIDEIVTVFSRVESSILRLFLKVIFVEWWPLGLLLIKRLIGLVYKHKDLTSDRYNSIVQCIKCWPPDSHVAERDIFVRHVMCSCCQALNYEDAMEEVPKTFIDRLGNKKTESGFVNSLNTLLKWFKERQRFFNDMERNFKNSSGSIDNNCNKRMLNLYPVSDIPDIKDFLDFESWVCDGRSILEQFLWVASRLSCWYDRSPRIHKEFITHSVSRLLGSGLATGKNIASEQALSSELPSSAFPKIFAKENVVERNLQIPSVVTNNGWIMPFILSYEFNSKGTKGEYFGPLVKFLSEDCERLSTLSAEEQQFLLSNLEMLGSG